MNSKKSPIAWIALRDGIAPIFGLAPDEIKISGCDTKEYRSFGHATRQNAICRELGFDCGLKIYKNSIWPGLQIKLKSLGLRERVDLLVPEVHLDIRFAPAKHRRRDLSDRLFFGPEPFPTHVFTGYGYDAEWWESLNESWPQEHLLELDSNPKGLDETRVWLHDSGFGIGAAASYFGNVYFKPTVAEDPARIPMYWHSDDTEGRQVGLGRCMKFAKALHSILLESEGGWLEVVKLTKNLVALKLPNGKYDLVWRNLRDSFEPAFSIGDEALAQPRSVVEGRVILRERYRETGVWASKDVHDSELRYYRTAIRGSYYPGADNLLEAHLREEGLVQAKQDDKVESSRTNTARIESSRSLTQEILTDLQLSSLPVLDGRDVSELITNGLFKKFVNSTSPRSPEVDVAFHEANGIDAEDSPVGTTYDGALAFCTWLESVLQAQVFLLSDAESRMLRPSLEFSFVNPEGFDKARVRAVMSDVAVLWSSDIRSTDSMSVKARWMEPVRLVEHGGVQFMDAGDAPEWCKNGTAVSLCSTEHFGTQLKTWGEYKRKKITFRVVVEKGC